MFICDEIHKTDGPLKIHFYLDHTIVFKCFFVMFVTKVDNTVDKPKVQVQFKTDDWVFINIGFSNHPASQPPGKVSKKQDTVIYPKQKLLVYIRRL